MSPEENVQVIQKAYADFKRGDIPAVLSALDESIEWSTPGGANVPTAGVRRGPAQVAEFFRIVNEEWEFSSFEPREYIASGDRVAVRGEYESRSRKTGRSASSEWVMLWRMRNGKAIHFQEFTDTAVLLAAVTPESAMHA